MQLSNLLDDYTIKARLVPALINVSPIIVAISLILHHQNFDVTIILGSATFSSLVIPLFLAEVFRIKGVEIENKNYQKWGGKPTTIILRRTDKEYDDASKNQIYKFIKEDFQIDLFNDSSDQNISNAIKHIIAYFHRNPDDLLRQHNVEYGLVRNLAGGVNFLITQLIFWLLFTGYRLYLEQSWTSIYVTIAVLVLLALVLILKYRIYPFMINSRAFRYARTLIELYYYQKSQQKRGAATSQPNRAAITALDSR
ncbi:MAG: hypothetical protein A4E55_01609 [Pelotomaculum sp. PtaU1.Bin035]|nr:MAG: hypothetical protein A4E55_01609 [Pelotomaculum sp. PtaU1.Bin035]